MSVKRQIGPLPNYFILAPIVYLYFLIRNTKTDYFSETINFFWDPWQLYQEYCFFSFGRRRWYIFVFIYISPVTRVRFPPGLVPFCKLSPSWDINATWDTHRNSKNSYQRRDCSLFLKLYSILNKFLTYPFFSLPVLGFYVQIKWKNIKLDDFWKHLLWKNVPPSYIQIPNFQVIMNINSQRNSESEYAIPLTILRHV